MAAVKKRKPNQPKRKAISHQDWIDGAKRVAAMSVTDIQSVTPRHNPGDTVSAATNIAYSDVTIVAGTNGVVRNATEFGNTIFYMVRFFGDTIDRLVRDNQLN